MIALNITLVFQIIGFFVLLVLLNKLLYGPIQKVLKERDEKIDGAIKQAATTEKDVEAGLVSYDKKIKDAAIKGNEERNRLRQEALDKEKQVLDAARTAAAAELSTMRKGLEASQKDALATLREESKTISKNIAERILDRKIVSILAFMLTTVVPALAFAAEEAHHDGGGMTWKLINFAILAIGVYLIWTKVINKLLDKRSAEIKQALDEAKAAKDSADKKAAEYNNKLATLERRIAEIQNDLKQEGEAEKLRIMKDSEASAAKIREQAKVAAEQEVKKARLEIRKEVASIAVGMAEEILKKELSPADQERLVKGYLNNLRLN